MLAIKAMAALGKPLARPALSSTGPLRGPLALLAERSLCTSPLLSHPVIIGPASEEDRKQVGEMLKERIHEVGN
jgi:hypothetical protein